MNKKQSFFKLFLSLILINIVLLTVVMKLYNGDFDGVVNPFSAAGDYRTLAGLPNTLSMYLYSLDMAVNGLILLVFAYKFYKKNGDSAGIVKPLLCVLAGCGFLIAGASPDDIRHPFHVLGSSMAIASLWIIATNYIYEIRKKIKPAAYFLMQGILQIPILAYAATYFLGVDPLSYILQKYALAGLCIALLYPSYIKEKK
ncbi:MAG: hypothetical protein WCI57_03400 [Candidatus Berkelbacteria bacterium]